jgi:hypothetical protein
VVSTHSLFLTAAADITQTRVRDLVEQNLPEGFTLEYKEAYTPRVVDSVAAMANTYGGLILVGVTDGVGADRLVGVDPDAVTTQIVSSCHDRIEPPWEPHRRGPGEVSSWRCGGATSTLTAERSQSSGASCG